ncbi:MAG: addiction module toxin, HicA family [Clostridia bacterium]|nr:addiction module toxin, HicA family [Clostridia bacterium]
MNFKYPVLSSKKIVQTLIQLGFYKVAQKGSHAKYKNEITNRICIVPMHSEVARGTLKSILEQADIELEEFLKYL